MRCLVELDYFNEEELIREILGTLAQTINLKLPKGWETDLEAMSSIKKSLGDHFFNIDKPGQ